MRLRKYHGLGNDYLVLESGEALDSARVRALCHRHTGVGSDGILEPIHSDRAALGLRIWNPDGSLAEKSGNGLRIFASWAVSQRSLPACLMIEVTAGVVSAQVHALDDVSVEMGRPDFDPAAIPCARALLDSTIEVEGATLRVAAVGMGNPHCVVLRDREEELDALPWRQWGAALEVHPLFPNRTNVQVVRPIDASHVEARIWERGAGETLASGSSACAVAAVAQAMGWTGAEVEIHMAGGSLAVRLDPVRGALLRGPVVEVATIETSREF